MKTLWINVMGFSSGNTGMVITDGSPPYDSLSTMNPTGEHDMVGRMGQDGRRAIISWASTVEEIRMLPYGGDHTKAVVVKFRQVQEALDSDEDGLTDLMPQHF